MATIAPQAPPSMTSDTIEKAVTALLKWKPTKPEATETPKAPLFEEDEFIYLILTLKKIPQNGTIRVKPYKIPVPNPLVDPVNDQTEICLIMDDRPNSGLSKEEVKQKVSDEKLPVSKIIRLSKLKANYKAYEAKRKLCSSFDMFLTDRRVVHLLPKLLGKEFFRRRKIPVVIDLMHKNWKEQIERACSSALVFLRSGTCSVIKIGRASMGSDEIVGNVVAAVNGVAEIVPKKWSGIRSLHLKKSESLALPIYQALPEFKLKIESGRDVAENEEGLGVDGKVAKEEKKKKGGKKKGRIQEFRYMDSNELVSDVYEDVNNNDKEDISEVEDTKMSTGALKVKKRRRGGDKGEDLKNEKVVSGKVKRKIGTKGKIADGVKPKKQKKDQSSLEDGNKKKKKKKLPAK